MKTTLTLLLCLTTLCTATGDEGVVTRPLYAAIGSAVVFPEVKIDNHTVFDLYGVDGSIAVTCHGGCTVMGSYKQRGSFNQSNGTFNLKELRANDSGIYKMKINTTMKAIVHLRVMAPVSEPVLLEERGNGSQCQIVFTCQAGGDGPLNFTFLRNGEEILQNEVSTDNTSSLTMDGWDPAMSGEISCKVANAVSSKTSTATYLLHPATLKHQILRLIAIASLNSWIFALIILFKRCISSRSAEGNEKQDNVVQQSRNSGKDKKFKLKEVFYIMDNVLGGLKELALVVACAVGSSL